jgi:hypothetical protein
MVLPPEHIKAHKEKYGRLSNEFYALLGRCISGWSYVDQALFNIMQSCLAPHYEQSAIIYFRTPGLEIRLNLTDELVRSLLPGREKKPGEHDPPSVKEWSAICKSIKALLPERRQLAHHSVNLDYGPMQTSSMFGEAFAMFIPGDGGAQPEGTFKILPTMGEMARIRNTAPPPLTEKEVKNHLQGLAQLTGRMSLFQSETFQPLLSELAHPDTPQTPETG